MAETIDLVKSHPELYRGTAQWARISVPPRTVLAVDGHGDPNTSPTWV